MMILKKTSLFSLLVVGTACASEPFNLVETEKPRILEKAQRYLQEDPRTVTADQCQRSAGGIHDFYSEGDYWWPNPNNPDAPYIRKDGRTNQKGGFPHELGRTKPYGYSLFMIDAMAGVAQIASTPKDNLWNFELPDGRGMKLGMKFIVPYIKDKSSWPRKPDVMYWNEWPVRHPSVLMASIRFKNQDYFKTWKLLEADPKTYEVLRNLPLRHPLLWVESAR